MYTSCSTGVTILLHFVINQCMEVAFPNSADADGMGRILSHPSLHRNYVNIQLKVAVSEISLKLSRDELKYEYD